MNEKYYLVRVEDLTWGVIERKIFDLKQAKIEYTRLKHKFKNVPCAVVLVSVEVIDDEYTEKIVYKKQLGSDVLMLNLLKDVVNCIEKYDKLRQLHRDTYYEYDVAPHGYGHSECFKIHHGLELLKLSQTTGEERDQILYNLEEALAIRRASKTEFSYSKMIKPLIEQMSKSVKSCIKQIESTEKANVRYTNSEKGIRNYKSFFESLDLDYDEFYPTSEEEPLEEINDISNIINIEEVMEENTLDFDKYDDKYFEYEEIYAQS